MGETFPVPDVGNGEKTFAFDQAGLRLDYPGPQTCTTMLSLGHYVRKGKVETIQILSTWNHNCGDPILGRAASAELNEAPTKEAKYK
jgi:hypothetical protein